MARRDPELLELYEPESAYPRIEDWLRARGFFAPGGEELVADLFLGYGLSQVIRRRRTPLPTEPCALPLAACKLVGDPRHVTRGRKPLAIGEWEATWSESEYTSAIELVREAIARGDVYQVNLVQHLSAACPGDPALVARALASALAPLRPLRASPFLGDGWAVVSASPELFLARRSDRVWTMPIKGTRPLGGAADLVGSEKDAAEHVMIVDLERNDLSRICRAGTVRWPELMETHQLTGVEHMVSTVEGTLRDGVGLAELLEATFPGGSVTGAPKIAALGSRRGAGARRSRCFHGRSRPCVRQRRLRACNSPSGRSPFADCADSSLGRGRRRLGLGPFGGGRGVLDQGSGRSSMRSPPVDP